MKYIYTIWVKADHFKILGIYSYKQKLFSKKFFDEFLRLLKSVKRVHLSTINFLETKKQTAFVAAYLSWVMVTLRVYSKIFVKIKVVCSKNKKF